MGLLDGGLTGIFGAAFGAVYLDGTLHRKTLTFAENGDATSTPNSVAIKGQVDQVSEAYRAAAGYTAKEQRLLILQVGVSPAPTTDDEITLAGTRWSISNVESDPANTYWAIRGERA